MKFFVLSKMLRYLCYEDSNNFIKISFLSLFFEKKILICLQLDTFLICLLFIIHT